MRIFRLPTLTTKCHLAIAQDILLYMYFAAVAPARPSSSWVSSLSLNASLRGVLCRVARWWQSPSWHLRWPSKVLPWRSPLGFSSSHVHSPDIYFVLGLEFALSPRARRESSCSSSLLVGIVRVRLSKLGASRDLKARDACRIHCNVFCPCPWSVLAIVILITSKPAPAPLVDGELPGAMLPQAKCRIGVGSACTGTSVS